MTIIKLEHPKTFNSPFGTNGKLIVFGVPILKHNRVDECYKTIELNINKASQAIQSPRTVPFFLLVSLLDGYSFPNDLVKGIVAFKH